jgi:hypothetical protein
MAAGEEEEDHEALEEELKDLEGAIEKRDARLAEMERNKKWNVDNMCKHLGALLELVFINTQCFALHFIFLPRSS